MFPRSNTAVQAGGLFVSPLQQSDDPSPGQIQQAVAATLDRYGVMGCAGQVAQEFGDHPEIAAARMRWARAVVAAARSPAPAASGDDRHFCVLSSR